MIWHRGEVVPEDSVNVNISDRTFQHGQGLFETFRTWNGQAPLLARHLERLVRSALELDLPLDPKTLPDASSVRALVSANGLGENARLRITLSGGQGTAGTLGKSGLLWMTAMPIYADRLAEGVVVEGAIRVVEGDPLARYKTLNYWRKAMAHAAAQAGRAHDVLCLTPEGWVCEASRYNLFWVEENRLLTPSTELPLLPGVMRAMVLEHAREVGVRREEGRFSLDRLEAASEAFLTNSVRGIVPISRLYGRVLPAPGTVGTFLWGTLAARLESAAGVEP